MPKLKCCTSPFNPELPSIIYCYCSADNGMFVDCIRHEGYMHWTGSAWTSGDSMLPARLDLQCKEGVATASVAYDDGEGCVFGETQTQNGCGEFFGNRIFNIPLECCEEHPGGSPEAQWEITTTGAPVPEAHPNVKCPCEVFSLDCACPTNGPSPVPPPLPAASPPVYSRKPVRYATGAVAVSASDLDGGGFGQSWGHSRSFGSQMSLSQTVGQGFNWQVSQWPNITAVNGGDSMVIQGDANNPIWFDKDGDDFVCFCDPNQLLDFDPGTNVWSQRHRNGTVTQFDGITGQFRSQRTPGGNQINVTALAANAYNIAQVERASTIGGVTTTERQSYDYQTTTGDHLVSDVTLQRKVGAGSFENVSRASYTYFNENTENGLQGDLQTATTKLWQEGSWVETGTTYYRYWLELASDESSSSSSSSGGDDTAPFAHLIKYVLNPASYDRMVADGHDPLTASDSQLSIYADNYFEYDSQRRVTRETVLSGSQTYDFEYFESGNDDDINHWQTKTIETLPNGNQNIVYSNYLGQTMLKVFQSGTNQWIDFWRYADNKRVIVHAHPSAVTGFDEAYPDLLNFNSEAGTFEFLGDDEGLIETYTYHVPTAYLASESVQEGQLGTTIPVRAWNYCQCGSSCGCETSSSSSSSGSIVSNGIWLVSREISYPDDAEPGRTIVTNHCYSFYEGTCAVQQHKTTLPVIPTEQNGSGVANSNREYFDEYGNLTWKMDERGFMTRMAYDIPTGAMTQQVQDVDTSLYPDAPAGWATPSGGGLNLISDFEFDDQGRTTQSLGPSHTIDLEGTATVIRTASWTVYDDANHITYSGEGFATGTAPDYDYTLVNPVSITKRDAGGRVNEQIQAAAGSTAGSLAEIIDAADGGASAFPQSSYTRWTTNQYTDCCLAASQRVYHAIPAFGAGSSGTNYEETDYGYDVMKRRNRTVSPGGTITDIVYEARGLVIGTYIGTNDDGATETDPTGGGLDPDNNMVIVTSNEYDGGTDGGDGNLTAVTQHVDATTTRVTVMAYDFRNRNVTTDGEVDYFQKLYYDNLNRIVKTERYDTTILGNLIARSETRFDELGRVYQSVRYGVDPSTGTVGNSLTDNTWFDQSGNVIKSLPSGSSLASKTTFDSLGRAVIMYRGYDLDETSYADAFTVTDDVILEQSETTFDQANNTIQMLLRQRYHNAPDTQTGALQNPTTTPKARVSYSAAWQEGIGRVFATANYGTNGGTALSRPELIPNASDTTLVSLTTFDAAGNTLESIDPAGIVTRFEYDDRGRKITQVDNYQPNSSSSSSSSSSSGGDCEPSDDTNRTTRYTFTPDGQQATMTAENWRTGDQTTTWAYGTTLDDSDLASSQRLRSVTYPDSESSSDVVSYAYNRQGQKREMTDQRGCVHVYEFDELGRQIHDRVTTPGSGVDTAVLRLSTTYEVRGMATTLTSWDNATINSGSAVNECQFVYNDFSQLITDYQEHDGAVNTSTTPQVQYGYEDGSANTVRPVTLTYPNGRVLTYGYGTSNGIDDAVSRISNLIDDDGTTHIVDYSFVGTGAFVIVDYTEPDVEYTLVALSGTNDPDTGDIYSGWDRFGRVKDCRWYDYGNSTDAVRLKYGYDRASDRLWRADLGAESLGKDFDELYAYDGSHRLKDMQRGLLNGSNTAITSENFAQCWSLDTTSNWSGFREAATGGSATLVQSRTANKVNEINGITNSVGSTWTTPAYDLAGNTTTLSQLADPTKSYTGTYDAWNRLVKLVSTTSSHTVQQNAYDARTFRTKRQGYTSGTLSETRQFYYTWEWQSIEERLGTSPDSSDPERQQVWGQRYVDDLVLRDRDTNGDGTLDERLYGLQDANWSIVALINTSAAAQERYLYSPFGTPMFLNGAMSAILLDSAFESEILFTGQHFDSSTRLYLFRNRHFDSLMGRFITRDPLDYPNGPNTYAGWFAPDKVDPYGFVMINCNCKQNIEFVVEEYTASINCTTIARTCCNQACGSGFSQWTGDWTIIGQQPDKCPPPPCDKNICRRECAALGMILLLGCQTMPPRIQPYCRIATGGIVALCYSNCDLQCV